MDQLSNRSESTRTHYKRYFSTFADWMVKTPNELIKMQRKIKDQPKADPRENRVLENKVKQFMNHMEGKDLSISTRKLAYAAILSFFKCNLFPLNMTSEDRPSGESRGSRIPEKHEIKRMLNAAKSRKYRATILLLKDSGMRISDAVQLRWRDVEDFGEGFWGWKILTRKRKVQSSPFVGPETTEALKMLERKDEFIFPISSHALSNAIFYIAKSAGVKDVSAHGLRKYFNVELQAARVPKEWRYQMMGKKTGPYDENRITKLFETYREAYDYLRIFGVTANLELEKIKKSVEFLREENRILREQINGITTARKESDTIMDQLFEDFEFKELLKKKLKEMKIT